ncbi:unnamed protein product [Ambrosiozyma monospora]|uniref:Unnamed protein product n=1 Tax=Ambrosiozyma monospora TaxID=43982 RepID=A0ACB5T849_AMBMO|nr:unnamed protein product [Ambrosiozyma monospora]
MRRRNQPYVRVNRDPNPKQQPHNSTRTNLTLLTSNYQISYSIVEQLVQYEISLNLLIQLDLLIQLLESPVFAKLRLDLLNPRQNPYLFKCLYGLLMLLPQSKSFQLLQNRLNAITPIMGLQLSEESNLSEKDKTLLEYFNLSQGKLYESKIVGGGNVNVGNRNGDGSGTVVGGGGDDLSSTFNSKMSLKDDDVVSPLETSSVVGQSPKKALDDYFKFPGRLAKK